MSRKHGHRWPLEHVVLQRSWHSYLWGAASSMDLFGVLSDPVHFGSVRDDGCAMAKDFRAVGNDFRTVIRRQIPVD